MNVGKALRENRLKKGIKQKFIAEKCGISREFLSEIENNVKNPSWDTLSKISKALDVPMPLIILDSVEPDDIRKDKNAEFEKYSKIIEDLFKLIE